VSDDGREDGGAVLPFPHVVLPGSLDAPTGQPAEAGFESKSTGGEDSRGRPMPAAGILPRLPEVSRMGPPLHLTVPGTPEPEPGDVVGAFAPPPLEDPDHPTGRDTLQLAMALMTAIGVAAAQGMWHRARHRQARADLARANADRAQAKAAGAGHHSGGHGGGHGGGRGGSKGGGLLTGSRHEGGGSRRRPGGSEPSGGGHRTKDPKRPKSPKGPRGDDTHNRDRKNGRKAPKSTRDGRRAPDPTGHRPKRRKRRKTKGGLGDAPCVQTRERRTNGKARTPRKRKNDKNTNGAGKQPARPRRTLRWKAPRKSKPGPGGDKAVSAGRKRWTRTAPGTGKPNTGKRGGKRAAAKRSRKPRSRKWAWRSTPRWLKRWRTRPKATAPGSTWSPGATDSHDARGRESWTRSTTSPGSEWMRPPPGADRTVRITVERVDERSRPREEPAVLAVTGAHAAGRPALPPATAGSPAASTTTSAPDQSNEGGRVSPPVPRPRAGAQYADAELTVYDVIDADADMAEEITEGVDEARRTADGCERLMTRLEALHAEIVDLKVPGVLAGMLLRLMDKTLTVKAKADAIAANLPAAAEAVQVAGSNAESRHRGLADAVRDAGHIRPAEREYHEE
jgi:hypothetical protein